MYIIFLITVTVSLVATATYFSVFGIASMFAYNYIPAMIMGITLESGKIGVAVYLFRYWSLMSRLFKSILMTFLVALMFITSVGIFGFLSQGYQKTSEDFKILSEELANLENEYATKKSREQEINRQIEKLPFTFVADKIRLSREFGDELAEIRDRMSVTEPRMQDLRVKRVRYESNIGPISYVAKMLKAPQDLVVFYAILVLVFVADPLAITLTIACNMVLVRYWELAVPKSSAVIKTPVFITNMVSKVRAMALDSYKNTFGKKTAKRGSKVKSRAR